MKGLPDSIDPNKPPRNYRDAMQREDRQEWAEEAYDKEYQGFIEQGTIKIARQEEGAKVLDTTTRADYKVTNGVFDKRKIRIIYFFWPQKFTFWPQPIFYPLFLNEDSRIRKNRPSKLHNRI